MGLDDAVQGKIKSDMTLWERIKMYIPGYRGYKERNYRRDEDRAVRNELSRSIQGTKQDLSEIMRGLIGTPLLLDVERVRTKVDHLDIDVKKAVNGYSGFHEALKVEASDLDRIVHWDAKIFDSITEMRRCTEELLDAVDNGNATKAMIRAYERGVDDLLEAYQQREAVMKGIAEGATETE